MCLFWQEAGSAVVRLVRAPRGSPTVPNTSMDICYAIWYGFDDFWCPHALVWPSQRSQVSTSRPCSPTYWPSGSYRTFLDLRPWRIIGRLWRHTGLVSNVIGGVIYMFGGTLEIIQICLLHLWWVYKGVLDPRGARTGRTAPDPASCQKRHTKS